MLALIAAVAENNCIGKSNSLPWYLPEDLKHFKKLTDGHTVLMGRKTWESIPEKFRPLPNRTNIVITRQTDFAPAGAAVFHTIEAALIAHQNELIFVIGGAEIYRQTIAHADILHITEVHKTIDGDAFFPTFDKNLWHETNRTDHGEYSFVDYKKIK